MATFSKDPLPLPPHFNPEKVGQVHRVEYGALATAAPDWARMMSVEPSKGDAFQTNLILIDVQNTFCLPDFELFVAGRSGKGAVEDNDRLCKFLYHNLDRISNITVTLDTHQATQIFHANFLVDEFGGHPPPYTTVTADEIRAGTWRFNPAAAPSLGVDAETGQRLLAHYTETLKDSGKFALTIWPYHAMLGGIGHALVSTIEEAIFFHTLTRASQADFIIKGRHPFTEHYSAVGPEVLASPSGEQLGEKSKTLLNKVLNHDAVIIAGQAKSHCVAWTLADLLADIQATDPKLAGKVYLLEDCTSPVVVPGADFTEQADKDFIRFEAAGMHIVKTTTPMSSWPGFPSS